jgi:hypothetical protein
MLDVARSLILVLPPGRPFLFFLFFLFLFFFLVLALATLLLLSFLHSHFITTSHSHSYFDSSQLYTMSSESQLSPVTPIHTYSPGTLVYEVNLSIPREKVDEYLVWLKAFTKASL